MLKSRRFLVGLSMTALFIGFFLYRADVGEMGRALASANYIYIVPGLLCYVMALVWRCVRWQVILRPLGHFPVRRLWPVMVVGYAANNILPMRLGELVRAYFLEVREGTSKSSAVATIVIERVFDGLALLFLVGLVSLFVPVLELLRDLGEQARVNWLVLVFGLSVPFFLITALIVGMAVWPDSSVRVLSRGVSLLPSWGRGSAGGLLSRFLVGLGALRSPRRVAAILLFSVPIWLSEGGLYYLTALSFGIEDTFETAALFGGAIILTTAASNLGLSVPASGGGVGPFEFFAQATLIFFGVTSAVASAYAVVLHAVLLVPVTILGLVYIWRGRLSLMGMARASQTRGRAATEANASTATEDGGS